MLIKIENYNISDIVDGVKFLLDRASNSTEVRQHAINISFDTENKIGAIYDWTKSHVNYTPDPVRENGDEIELFTSPVKMVNDWTQGKILAGDCDDMAILVTSLYRAIGIKANVVIIDSVGNGLDHAFCQVWSDKLGQFIVVDPSSSYPLGWELQYKERIVVD